MINRPSHFRRKPLIEELEPRLLFSADVSVLGTGWIAPVNTQLNHAPIESSLSPGAETVQLTVSQEQARRELVFIDPGVAGYQQILADIQAQSSDSRTIEAILLDAQDDGLAQISDVLSQRQGIDAVHIISHGSNGSVQLGGGQLNLSTLSSHSAQISSWGSALNADADILIYGCDVAAAEDGRTLVSGLATLTGADVAASEDRTGHASLDGNWVLEYQVGQIETRMALSACMQGSWVQVLATETLRDEFNVESYSNNDGTQSWMSDWIESESAGASGPTSGTIRWLNFQLQLSATNVGEYIYRAANLDGAQSATLTYNYDSSTFNQWAAVQVQISDNGGASYTTLKTYSSANAAVGSENFDISGYLSANTQIRFLVTGAKNNSIIRLDNIQIAYVTATNSAPVLDSSKSPALIAINEDAGAPSGAVGTLVSSLVDFATPTGQLDNVTDADSGAQLGIAITAANTANGSWWYSLNNGGSWSALGNVSDASARLLAADSNTRVYFQPNANYNGAISNALTFRAWDQTSGSHGALANTSTNGGSSAFSSVTDTASLVVNAVNDAPTGSNKTVTTLEDNAYVFAVADFGFSDPFDSPANTLLNVKITSLPGAGNLTLNGFAVTTGQFVSAANINAGLLRFTPAANANGSGYASFTFQVQDNGGTANGGVNLDPSAKTMTVNVTPVNDAPTTSPVTLAPITEDSGGRLITQAELLANASDVDGPSLTAINLAISSGNGSLVNNNNGTWTYTPALNDDSGVSFSYTVTDGSLTAAGTATLDITPVNDAPTAINMSVAETYQQDTPQDLINIVISDVDGDTVTVTLTLSDTAAGVLTTGTSGPVTSTFSAGVWTASGALADVNALLAAVEFIPASGYVSSFSIATRISDGIAADVTGVKNMTGPGVNINPVATDDRLSLNFDGIDDYVQIGSDARLVVSNTLTMEAWIKPVDAGPGSKIIINKEGEYEVARNGATGQIMWAFANSNPGWVWHNTGYVAQAGVWTHIAVSYNAGVVNTYANGVLVETYNGAGSIGDVYTGMNDLRIGGRSNNPANQYFQGEIQDVRIWNMARTSGEIAGNQYTVLNGTETGLLGNWRLDNANGTLVLDSASAGIHGTLGGGTAGQQPVWGGYSIAEDTTLNVSASGVLANDSDADNDALTAVLVSPPSFAKSFTLNMDGSFIYVPMDNFNGVDSFVYRANDGIGNSNTATVSIRVLAVNDAPVAHAGGSYVTSEGSGVTLNASGSTDVDGDVLAYSWDINNDGVFGDRTGVATTLSWSDLQALGINDSGSYIVKVRVDDGVGGIHVASATLTVNNTAPTLITTGNATAVEGQAFTLNLSSIDPGNDTISSWTIHWGDGQIETFVGNPSTVSHVYQGGGSYLILASATDEDGVYLQNDLLVSAYNSDNVYRYGATTGAFAGTFGRFADGLDGPYNLSIGPDGNIYVSGWLSSNIVRYAPDGSFIDVFVASGSGGLSKPYDIAFGPDGQLYVTSDGTNQVLRYNGQTGAFIDIFATTTDDGLTGPIALEFDSAGRLYVSGYVSNNILRYDITSKSLIDVFVTAGSGGANSLEAMRFGPDGHLYAVSFNNDRVLRYNGETGAYMDTFVSAGSGGLSRPSGLMFGPDGHLYVSGYFSNNVLRYDGTTGAFMDAYVPAGSAGLVKPGYGAFMPGHIVKVNASPDLVMDQTALVYLENAGPVALDPSISIRDFDSATLSYATLRLTGNYAPGEDVLSFINTATISGLWDPGTGTLTLWGNDTVANYQAALRSVTYTNTSEGPSTATRQITLSANDGASTSAIATRSIEVVGVNDAPQRVSGNTADLIVAEDSGFTSLGLEGLSYNTGVGGKESGQTLIYIVTALPDAQLGRIMLADGVNAVTLGSSYTLTQLRGMLFETSSDAHGGPSTFSFVVQDNGGTENGGQNSLNESLTITVTPVNDAPTLVNAITLQHTAEDAAFSYQVAANTFMDVDGDALTYRATLVTGADLPAWLRFDPGTRSFSGTPLNEHVGTISIRITVDDGRGGSSFTDFDLVVTNTNDAPFGGQDSLVARQGQVTVISAGVLLANDGDIDGDSITISAFTQPLNGTLVDLGDGNFAYKPNTGFTGQDSFTYTVSDGHGGHTEVTVTMTVEPAPDVSASIPGSPGLPSAPPGNGTTPAPQVNAPTDPNNAMQSLRESLTDRVAGEGTEGQGEASDIDEPVLVTEAPASETAQEPANPQEEASGPAKALPQTASVIARIVLDPTALSRSLDGLTEQFEQMKEMSGIQNKLAVHIVSGTTVSLSAGFVAWVLRGGSLFASLMSTLPLWKGFDPLPVLGGMGVKSKAKRDAKSNIDPDADRDRAVDELFGQSAAQTRVQQSTDGRV